LSHSAYAGRAGGSLAGIAPAPVPDELLTVNQAFYEAFEARDLEAMSEVWEHSDRVRCTHPGWPTLSGWAAVSGSFLTLFTGDAPLQFILTNVQGELEGGVAWLFVDENILGGEEVRGTVAAVNLYTRDGDGRWRMVMHHGSPVVPASGGGADWAE